MYLTKTVKFKYVLLILNSFIVSFLCENSFDSRDEQEDYLKRYAYLGSSSPDPRMAALVNYDDKFKLAVKTFQKMAGLETSGEMDEETKKIMLLPRCGVKDLIGESSVARRKRRYLLEGSNWEKNKLTYKFINTSSTSELDAQSIKNEIIRAIKIWENSSALIFEEHTEKDTNRPDIEIGFYKKKHAADLEGFDGRGNVLAHAFFPSRHMIGGDIHFDDDEIWTINTTKGSDIFMVALHELGHSLGLAHSDVKNSMMAPFYRGFVPNAKLEVDDIAGIQFLYGVPDKKKESNTGSSTNFIIINNLYPTSPKYKVQQPSICSAYPPDATFSIFGTIFLFKGDIVFLMNNPGDKKAIGYFINQYFADLPSNLDAAFYKPSTDAFFFNTINGGYIWFFKDDKTYKYSYRYLTKKVSKEIGYPKQISEEFPGVPNNLDSAYVWRTNGKLYFIKDDKYYKYSFGKGKVSNVDVRASSLWRDFPEKIHSALSYAPRFQSKLSAMYVFEKEKVYKFDELSLQRIIDFPKDFTWFSGCSSLSAKFSDNENNGAFNSQFNDLTKYISFAFCAISLIQFLMQISFLT